MGITTFSGPIKAGTIKSTTGTTLGTDVKNTGQVVMAQTFSTGTDLAAGASAANTTNVIIPANSQIIDCVIDCPTAMAGATAVLSIGDTVGGNSTYVNAFSITAASGVGRKYPTTEAAHWRGRTQELQTSGSHGQPQALPALVKSELPSCISRTLISLNR